MTWLIPASITCGCIWLWTMRRSSELGGRYNNANYFQAINVGLDETNSIELRTVYD